MKTKILVLLLGMSSISLLIFLFISSYFMKKQGAESLALSMELGTQAATESKVTLKNQTQKYMLSLVKSQAVYTTSLFDKVESGVNIVHDYAREIMSHPQQFKSLTTYYRDNKPAEPNSTSVVKLAPRANRSKLKAEIDLISNMDYIFKPVHDTDENVLAVYIGTKNGIFKRFPWKNTIADSYDPRIRGWYKEGAKHKHIGWTMPYIGATVKQLMVTCYRGVYDDKNNFVGVVASDVTVESILEMISTHVKNVGEAYVIDKKGNVIAYPGKTGKYDYMNADNLLKTTNADLKSIVSNMVAGKVGIHKYVDDDGVEKFLAYAPITNAEWSIGVEIPVDKVVARANLIEHDIQEKTGITLEKIDSTVRRALVTIVLFCVLIIVVAAFIGRNVANKLSQPIIELTNGVELVGTGQLDHNVIVRTGDEIQRLSEAFNKMTRDLKLYIKELQTTTAAKEKIESELGIAQKIQASMLPRIFPPFPDRSEFNIFATMNAAKEVGGDFYDFFLINENKLCFIVADVSGKGVPASLFMVIAKTLIKNEALRDIPAEEILYNVNNTLIEDNDESLFVTALLCVLDVETGNIQYSNAGHNPPLVCRNGQTEFEYINVDKNFVIGGMPDIHYTRESIKLEKGDYLYLYTDGVTEAMDKDNVLYSEERLKGVLSGIEPDNRKVTDIESIIQKDIDSFVNGAEQSDDITMLVFKYNGPSPGN